MTAWRDELATSLSFRPKENGNSVWLNPIGKLGSFDAVGVGIFGSDESLDKWPGICEIEP